MSPARSLLEQLFSSLVKAALTTLALLCLSPEARAEEQSLRLLPVFSEKGDTESSLDESTDPALARAARQLIEVLTEAGYDLGFEVQASEQPTSVSEDELFERAQGGFVVSPRIERVGAELRVRLVAAAPNSRVLLVRSETMPLELLEVRAVQMLRDLVQTAQLSRSDGPSEPNDALDADSSSPGPRSSGRAPLALNAALLGGYVGFALQRASGSDDERLTYPLAAVGAGFGLGASLLVAEEWDVGVGDAWYLSAGIWWPLGGSLLLAESYGAEIEDHYIYGLIGASAGLAVATTALTLSGGVSEGSATIVHSGGAFGLGLGGLAELFARGETDHTPTRGFGYGAIAGVIAGGALATQVELPTSRVLLVDLGASLGALGGAALGSPLLLVEGEANPTRTRLWLSAVGVGTLAGGAAAYFLTQDLTHKRALLPFTPYANVTPDGRGGTRAELGATGTW